MPKKLDPKTMGRLDWSQQDAVLARKLNVSPATIWRWRRFLSKPSPPTYRSHPMASLVARRATWNWELSNADLARIHGVSRERVRQIRKQAQP